MSYVRINAAVEYDPATNTVRQDGQTRPAGLAALGFSTILEVQQQLRGESPEVVPTQSPAPAASPRGQLTASGAPLISLSATPAPNPWDYQGPAAHNPYYITPGTPMEEGLVQGYELWFQPAQVCISETPGAAPTVAYTMRVTTEEGAQEALRLVQEYVPEATLEATVFGAQGGSWCADRPTHYIVLPGGCSLNAAAILDSYYHRGRGVTALSDLSLRAELRWQTGMTALG